MRRIALFLTILISTCQLAWGAPQVFESHNFSLEIPGNWAAITPLPPQALIGAQSADGLKSLFVTANKVPAAERSTFSREMIAGARQSTLDKGWQITNERETSLGGVSFHTFTTRLPTGGSIVTYIGTAGEQGYILQGLCKSSDAETDEEIGTAIQSFTLLATHDAQTSPPPTPAYRIGNNFGQVLFLVLLAVAVIWLIKRTKNKPSN